MTTKTLNIQVDESTKQRYQPVIDSIKRFETKPPRAKKRYKEAIEHLHDERERARGECRRIQKCIDQLFPEDSKEHAKEHEVLCARLTFIEEEVVDHIYELLKDVG